jgi:hypothetical protein
MPSRTFKDLTEQRFGRLIVKERLANISFGVVKTTKRTNWLCLCDCGKTTQVLGTSLRRPKGTKSCGCLSKETRFERSNQAIINRILRSYKSGAKQRNLDWSLPINQFESLIFSDCHYCGAKPVNCVWRLTKYRKGSVYYNGIDRVDNRRGYLPDNVVSCCRVCNLAKGTMTTDEFISWVFRVAKLSGREQENGFLKIGVQ